MSDHSLRTEKDCLNCGTLVQGRFCHVCGQENKEPKESFWHLVNHFFADITHFDGKFFHSIKYLFTRPGFLPKEYMAGRRASYLNPVRMYIFTSAFFFLVYFSFLHKNRSEADRIISFNGFTIAEIDNMDSAAFATFTADVNRNDKKPAVPMTREEFKEYQDSSLSTSGIHFTNTRYKSRDAYDSVLKSGTKKHNWFQRKLIYKEIDANVKYKGDSRALTNAYTNVLIHSIPQMLFISLPLFAFLLKFIYFRRKQFFYLNHAMFTIYLYIFIFLALLIRFTISRINSGLDWSVLKMFNGLLITGIFFYAYKAMHNFYGQGWFKTLMKFLLLLLLFFIVMGLLLFVFIVFSFFNV